MSERLLIIGWDGADWEILDDLMHFGCLPNIESMLQGGARGTLLSTIPDHSWAAWSTFLTGLNPGGHGVFDFVERDPVEPQRRIPVSSGSIKAETFFERLSRAGHEIRAANVPVTYPPFQIRGRMISGITIPHGQTFVYPRDFGPELERRAPFPTNGMEWTQFRDHPQDLIDEARSFIERRTASFEVLLEGNWKVATCVYIASDRLQHAFGAYLLPTHPDHARLRDTPLAASIRDVYRLLDHQIERLREAAGPETTAVLISDHGFGPVNRASNLNQVLCKLGMATPTRTGGATTSLRRSALWRTLGTRSIGYAIKRRARAPATLDWSKTMAYRSSHGGGVSINLKGREVKGIVDARDYERVRQEVREALLGFKDAGGDSPVAEVLLREELYSGDHIDLAPDLLVRPTSLWTLTYTDAAASVTDWPTGDHRRTGVVLAAGGRTMPGELGQRDLADMSATALAFCGVPASAQNGSAIEEIAGRSDGNGRVPSTREQRRQTQALTQQDENQIADHLRNLGYIE